MEDMNIRKIGGSKRSIRYGNLLTRLGNWYINRGNKHIAKGQMTVISNPTCKFINPYTLMLSFTVNTNNKYQLIVQGDFKEKYKISTTEDNPIPTEEMFMVITHRKREWFLKA